MRANERSSSTSKPLKTSAKKLYLEDFARAVEEKLNQAKGPEAMANLICRLLTSKDPRIVALMASKWVEWRYGKPKEHLEHSGLDGAPIRIINHVPSPGDPPEPGEEE